MHVNLHTIFHLLGHNDFLRFEEEKKMENLISPAQMNPLRKNKL